MTTIFAAARLKLLTLLGGVDAATAHAREGWLDKTIAAKDSRITRMHHEIEGLIESRARHTAVIGDLQRMVQRLTSDSDTYRARIKAYGEQVGELKASISELAGNIAAFKGRENEAYATAARRARANVADEVVDAKRERTFMKGERDYARQGLDRAEERLAVCKERFDQLMRTNDAGPYVHSLHQLNDELQSKIDREFQLPTPDLYAKAETYRDPGDMMNRMAVRIRIAPKVLDYHVTHVSPGYVEEMEAAALGDTLHRIFKTDIVPGLWEHYRHACAEAVARIRRN